MIRGPRTMFCTESRAFFNGLETTAFILACTPLATHRRALLRRSSPFSTLPKTMQWAKEGRERSSQHPQAQNLTVWQAYSTILGGGLLPKVSTFYRVYQGSR